MKKLFVLLLMLTVSLTLVGCDLIEDDLLDDPVPVEVDCELNPEHEDCVEEVDCDLNPEHEDCVEEVDCDLNPEHEDCEEPLYCMPGTMEENGVCVDILTQEDCDLDEMVVDNKCVINPDYVAPEFPVLPGPDYVSQGYDEYLGRDIVNEDCSHLENIGEWQPVWCDEFEYEGLPNSSLWAYDVGGHGWGNGELQYYTNGDLDNAYVQDGYLTIEALKESFGGSDYTSARLITKNKGDWTYGKIQIRAKVPGGKGTWPAAWLLPTDWEYGGWPDSGEIDIMEYVGVDPNVVHSTIHTGAYNHSIGTQVGKGMTLNTAETEFHVYEMEWEPNVIRYYVNGYNFYTVTYDPEDSMNVETWEAWPFDKDFHLLLNLAFGGAWGGYAGIDTTLDNMKFEIDYVRVYQKDYAGMDNEAPSSITNLRVLNETNAGSFIAWNPAEDDVMVEYYEVYIDDVFYQNESHNAVTIPFDVQSSEGSTLKVIPVDFAGNKGDAVTIAITAPEPPEVLLSTDRIQAEDYFLMNGVQLESTTDRDGGYNVGYIDNGDYMVYYIEVTEAGQYQFKVRVASQSDGGSFTILQDNVEIGTCDFNATGGWQNWADAYTSVFNLEVGTYTFKIQSNSDGWNINYFDFVKTN